MKKSAHSIDQRRAAFEEAELQVPSSTPQRRRSSVTRPNADQVQAPTEKPIIVQGLSKLHIDLSSPCALTCKSKHDTEQQWIKDGRPIDFTKITDGHIFAKVDRLHDENIHVLNIKQFKQENIGKYELILKNNLGEVHSQGQLDMKGVPPSFTLEPKTTSIVKGKMVEFNCRVAGSPKPDVTIFLEFNFNMNIFFVFDLGAMVS